MLMPSAESHGFVGHSRLNATTLIVKQDKSTCISDSEPNRTPLYPRESLVLYHQLPGFLSVSLLRPPFRIKFVTEVRFLRFLPALTLVACRTRVKVMNAVREESISHLFVFHLVDHLCISMVGRPHKWSNFRATSGASYWRPFYNPKWRWKLSYKKAISEGI